MSLLSKIHVIMPTGKQKTICRFRAIGGRISVGSYSGGGSGVTVFLLALMSLMMLRRKRV